jgi:hypothetical protein
MYLVDLRPERCTKVQKKIEERIGRFRLDAIIESVLVGKVASVRFRTYIASCLVGGHFQGMLTQDRIDLSILRLREGLSDPNAHVRSIALYGLANAGEKGRELLSEIGR